MDLFNTNPTANLLPHEGEAYYYGQIMNTPKAIYYFDQLWNNIEWRNDESFMFGKRIITKRKVAWYGDRPFPYTYSNTTKVALPWTEDLLQLKSIVEEKAGDTFNSCLLNLYHDGSEGMGWHSDGEKELKKNGAIASVSLGADRKFAFKHKTTKEKIDIFLEKGSLLVMTGTTQKHWLHRLPPTKKVKTARINLTFRTINLPVD